jgi:hypothetical protein
LTDIRSLMLRMFSGGITDDVLDLVPEYLATEEL